MALGINYLTAVTNQGTDNSQTSASFTPTADAVLIVAAFGSFSNGVADWDIDDSETLTWTEKSATGNVVATSGDDTSGILWTAPVGASPASMTVTVDYHGTTGTTVAEMGFAVYEIVDGDDTDPFAQIVSAITAAGGSGVEDMTTGTLTSPTELVGAVFLQSILTFTSWDAPPATWDQVTGAGFTDEYTASNVLTSDDTPTSVTYTTTPGSQFSYASFIFELNTGGGGSTALSGTATAELTTAGAATRTVPLAGSAAAELTTLGAATATPPGITATVVLEGRFADYADNRSDSLVTRFELLAPDGSLLATNDPTDIGGRVAGWAIDAPELTVDPGSRSIRSLRCSGIGGSGFNIDDLDPDRYSRVRVASGPVVGGSPIYFVLGTLLVESAKVASYGGLVEFTIELLDATSPVDADLTRSFTFDSGEPCESVASRLLSLVVPAGRFDVAPTGRVVPDGALTAGDNIGQAVAKLLGGCGHELTADPFGQVVAAPVPPSNDDAASAHRWRYGQEKDLPVHSATRVMRRSNPKGFVIEGGGAGTSEVSVSRTVVDNDPLSRGYYQPGREVTLPKRSFPWLLTDPQADDAGYALLRREGDGPGIVELEVAPNPAMRPFDLIDLEREADPAINGAYQVLGFRLPLDTDSNMGVTARRLWTPAGGQPPSPVELTSGFQASFTDDFDRADEDLQGDVWLEIYWSWGIEDRQAIQRYNNGYSMALVRQGLQHTNQFATTTISKLPHGRPVGPVVRSGGAFEGYAAQVTESGRVTLESWVGCRLDERLGEYQSAVSLIGRDITITAIETTIEVAVDGETVISVDDDAHSGATMVGMLALGGPSSNAPSVDYFEAGEAVIV